MSFGFSVGDAIILTQLSWGAVEGARNACGEYDELIRDVASLHAVLQRVRDETADPEPMLSRADEARRTELANQVSSCERVLKIVDSVLTKYDALEEVKRSGKKL